MLTDCVCRTQAVAAAKSMPTANPGLKRTHSLFASDDDDEAFGGDPTQSDGSIDL